ncbi:hypothetical protein QI633_06405 [Nocardioides sp. QY071]|uniref:hypothetical protein n=1 Tax=Nocardioides sp. QY071 TaxID=3044187 RepID=UPI00249CBC1A|nr:hypothetical protein [Nocardioides sp. QY071]WGY03390.1 hypothetical protein QI633_06405 [Nocardioides sp. QY071]
MTVDTVLASALSDLDKLVPTVDRMGSELKATSTDYESTDIASGALLAVLLTLMDG